MRRERRNGNIDYAKGASEKKILMITGGILAVAVLVFAISYVTYSNKMKKVGKIDSGKIASMINNTTENTNVSNQNQTQQGSEQASSQMGKTVEEMQNNTSSNQIENKVENKAENTVKQNMTNTTSNNLDAEKKKAEKAKEPEETEEETKETTFMQPVEGDVIKEYAKDNLVYSNTLKEWTTHQGVDIKADKATVVKATADGTIKAIKNDPRYGLTIVMEHKDGYTSVYANLLSTEFVVVGESVKQGDSIGTIGNSATFEVADESHLHFEILKDNIAQDPMALIK